MKKMLSLLLVLLLCLSLTACGQTSSDSGQEELEWKLRFLEACGAEQPEVTVTYFRPDHRKEGGSRVRISGSWKRLDEQQRMLVPQDGTRIPVEDLLELESPLLEQPEDSP